jgi:glycyl-tRNA synthetase (class II)
MAEIEHFCDPSDKRHPKFFLVKDTELLLYSASNQMNGQLPEKQTVGNAVKMVRLHLSPFHRIGFVLFYLFCCRFTLNLSTES